MRYRMSKFTLLHPFYFVTLNLLFTKVAFYIGKITLLPFELQEFDLYYAFHVYF